MRYAYTAVSSGSEATSHYLSQEPDNDICVPFDNGSPPSPESVLYSFSPARSPASVVDLTTPIDLDSSLQQSYPSPFPRRQPPSSPSAVTSPSHPSVLPIASLPPDRPSFDDLSDDQLAKLMASYGMRPSNRTKMIDFLEIVDADPTAPSYSPLPPSEDSVHHRPVDPKAAEMGAAIRGCSALWEKILLGEKVSMKALMACFREASISVTRAEVTDFARLASFSLT